MKNQGRYLHFLLGCFVIYIFIFQLVPKITATGQSAKMTKFLNQNNIDATPIFYSASEEGGEATFLMSKRVDRQLITDN